MGCLNCGKELVNTPGKKQKKFCNTSCRSSYGQKKKRGAALTFAAPKKAGRPRNPIALYEELETKIRYITPESDKVMAAIKNAEDPNQHTEIYDVPIKTMADEYKMYNSGQAGTDLLISVAFPKDFAGILRLAKEWKGDKTAFKNKVDGLKLTPNQKSMILSKLK